jgi:hypothetical protein
MITKTVLVTGSVAMVGVLWVVLLTLFGPTSVASQYVKFAILVVSWLAILVGSYRFVMVPSGRTAGGRTRAVARAEGILVKPESSE